MNVEQVYGALNAKIKDITESGIQNGIAELKEVKTYLDTNYGDVKDIKTKVDTTVGKVENAVDSSTIDEIFQ